MPSEAPGHSRPARANSRRSAILEAALAVVERGGVSALTIDSVAAEAGLTKGGLLYHFASREALLLGVQEHLAQLWEARLVEALGKQYDAATAGERLVAYVSVSVEGATTAALSLFVESSRDPALAAPWLQVVQRWAPPPSSDLEPSLAKLTARLAADGLWALEAHSGSRLAPQLRDAVAHEIVAMAVRSVTVETPSPGQPA